MNWVYDIILLVLFAYIIIRGWRNGILSSVLRMAGWAIAVFLIVAFTAHWAQLIYQNFLEPWAVSSVASSIPDETIAAMNSGADALTQIQGVVDSLSSLVDKINTMFGGNLDIDTDVALELQGLMGMDATQLATLITQMILQPVLIAVARVALSAVILLVSVLLFNFLSRLSAKRTKEGEGALTRTNQIIGAAAGVLECVAVGFVAAYVLELIAGMVNRSWLSPEVLQKTYLLRVFMSL